MSRIIYLLYRAFETAVCLLPLSGVVRLGRLLGGLAWLISPQYRNVAYRNLTIAFPEKYESERRAMVRSHFITLGGNLLAGAKLVTLPKDKLLAVVEVEGREHLDNPEFAKTGHLCAVSHLGNWELFALLWPLLMNRPCGTIYQRLGNPFIDSHVRKTRSRWGLELFERKEGFVKAGELLKNRGCLGVLIDQHAGDAGVWCPLFNRLASTTSLPATLAQRSGAVIFPLALYTNGIGRWKCVVSPPLPSSRDVQSRTAELNLALEKQIRIRPEDWFWVHNRWKTPSPKFLLATYKRGVAFANERQADSLQPFKILIRSSNWLGDAVMSVPAVRAIKQGRPDAHITILCPAKLEGIWKLVKEVDSIIPFPPKRGIAHLLHVKSLLAGGRFDAAVVFPNSIKTALEVWLAGIPRRVGFPGHSPRATLLNQVFRKKKKKRTTAPPKTVHQVYHYLELAKFIGADTDGITAENCFESYGHSPASGQLRIALCPGAEYGPAKRWLPDRYAEVIQQVNAGRDIEWLLVGVAKDRAVAEEIVVNCGDANVKNLCGKTSLDELIQLLRESRLLLTNDTGTMHLATLIGTPTVSIFGSTEPALTGPLGEGHAVLRNKVDCSPCFLRECPIDFRCMKAVTTGEAVKAVNKVLGI